MTSLSSKPAQHFSVLLSSIRGLALNVFARSNTSLFYCSFAQMRIGALRPWPGINLKMLDCVILCCCCGRLNNMIQVLVRSMNMVHHYGTAISFSFSLASYLVRCHLVPEVLRSRKWARSCGSLWWAVLAEGPSWECPARPCRGSQRLIPYERWACSCRGVRTRVRLWLFLIRLGTYPASSCLDE